MNKNRLLYPLNDKTLAWLCSQGNAKLHTVAHAMLIWLVEPCVTLVSDMKRSTTILIDFQGINDPAYPQPISPDSEFWFDWLEKHSSFRFLENHSDGLYFSNRFTANKDSRGYWTASRKIDGKLRRKRLGNSQQLKYSILVATAQILREDYRERDIHTEYKALRRKYEIQKAKLSWLKHYKKKCQELEAEIKQLKETEP